MVWKKNSKGLARQDSSLNQIKIKYRCPLRGEIICPPDKSISHRAIMLSSLANGKSIVRNFLRAEDPMRTLGAFRQMGINITLKTHDKDAQTYKNEVIINGRGLIGLNEPAGTIDCGNSGTTMRLLSGVLAGQPFSSQLSGDSSLKSRPMQRIITPLSQMGAIISSEKDGYPPLKIEGGSLRPISYSSPVASAQVKSAILLAGLYCDGVTTVIEPGKSRDHTEKMLMACGADINVKNATVTVRGMNPLNAIDITIPGDFSSAAYFIAAGLLVPESEILVRDTGVNPTRTGLIDILSKMGADIKLENIREVSGELVADILVKYSKLKGIDIKADEILTAIDEFPIICIAASCAEGTTRITGAKELRVKESDRIASMASELLKMGAAIEELEDGLVIEGAEELQPASVDSHGDHRIAMSLAIAGLTAKGQTTISDTDCVNTSFPEFMTLIEGLQH